MTAKNIQTTKIFHPVLFSLYPVLFLMSANLGEIPFQESWRVIVFVPIISAIIWLSLKLIIRDNQKAALIAAVLLISFFVYGHLYNYLGQEEIFGGVLRRHRYLIPLFVLAILMSSWWVIKKTRNLDSISQAFNIISLVLLVFPVYQIAFFEIRSLISLNPTQEEIKISNKLEPSSIKDQPDIYYIILDAYGRKDILLDLYNYDNSAFLTQLRGRGFYVADCSMSNYEKTYFSLVSSLNMNYLDELGGDALMKSGFQMDLVKARRLIVDNEVRQFLESKQYATVAFQTGFYWTRWDDADHFFSYYDEKEADIFRKFFTPLNSFESLLIETSAGRLVYDSLNRISIVDNFDDDNVSIASKDETRQIIRYNTVNYTLDTLEKIPSSIKSPKFVFAHIISPHQPFVFNADGSFVSDTSIQENTELGYPNQVAFLNQRILTIVDTIIATSGTPPVIIIQGDHGPPETNFGPSRLAIFNAYYLPEEGDKNLYESITPVNSFRVILDHYFGTNYGLLDDIVRNSVDKDDLFNFKIVPNTCQGE